MAEPNDLTLHQVVAHLDFVAFAVHNALSAGLTVDQVDDAVAYARGHHLRDPRAALPATSRIREASPQSRAADLHEALVAYREHHAAHDTSGMNPGELADYDETNADLAFEIAEATEALLGDVLTGNRGAP